MKILAAFYMSEIMPTIPVCCAEPRTQPFISFFGGTVVTPDQTAWWITDMIQYLNGKEDDVAGAGNATIVHTTKEYVALADIVQSNDEFTVTISHAQLLRMLCRFYVLQTTRNPSFMEVELLSHKPHPEQIPIREIYKQLPLIRLEDPIELPEELKHLMPGGIVPGMPTA